MISHKQHDGATCGVGSAYPSGAPRSPLVFGGVRVVYSLVFYVVSCVLQCNYALWSNESFVCTLRQIIIDV